MKKLVSIFFILPLFFICVSCGDDEDEKEIVPQIQLSQTSCSPDSEAPVIITIKNASGEYSVKSSNESVAIAYVLGDKVYVWGNQLGKAVISVKDANSNVASINVEINKLIPRAVPVMSLVFVKQGTFKELSFPLKESDIYFIDNSNPEIASLSKNGNKIQISGLKVGETEIMLMDINLQSHGYYVRVVDLYDLILSKSEITIPLVEEYAFHIHSGNEGYKIESTDTTILTTELIPYTFQSDNNGMASNPATVKVKPLKAGNVTLTIVDKEGKKAEIKIRVL